MVAAAVWMSSGAAARVAVLPALRCWQTRRCHLVSQRCSPATSPGGSGRRKSLSSGNPATRGPARRSKHNQARVQMVGQRVAVSAAKQSGLLIFNLLIIHSLT